MVRKGRGWHGEPRRHSLARRGKGKLLIAKAERALESTKLDKLYAERLIAAAAGDLKKLELLSIQIETELEHLERAGNLKKGLDLAKADYIKAFERAVEYDTPRNRERLVQSEKRFDHAIALTKAS